MIDGSDVGRWAPCSLRKRREATAPTLRLRGAFFYPSWKQSSSTLFGLRRKTLGRKKGISAVCLFESIGQRCSACTASGESVNFNSSRTEDVSASWRFRAPELLTSDMLNSADVWTRDAGWPILPEQLSVGSVGWGGASFRTT